MRQFGFWTLIAFFLFCNHSAFAQFDDTVEPQFSFFLDLHTAPETVGDPKQDSYLRVLRSNVFWRPDMSIGGRVAMTYESSQGYVVISKEKQFDLRKNVSILKLSRDGREIPLNQLPPLRLTLSYQEAEIMGDTDFIIYKDKNNERYPLIINFEFAEGVNDFIWQSGEYQLSLKIDYAPEINKPKIASFFFRVKQIEKPNDRLNVYWYRYNRFVKGYLGSISNGEKIREGLPNLNALIDAFPHDALLLYQRARAYHWALMRREEIADLRRAVELMKSGESPTILPVIISPFHGEKPNRERSIRFHSAEADILTVSADAIDYLDRLTTSLSEADKDKVAYWAKSHHWRGVPEKAFKVIEKLKLHSAIPALLEILEHPEGTNMVTNCGASSGFRKLAWQTLQTLRTDVKPEDYNPLDSNEERKAAVEKLRILFVLQ